MATFLDIIAIRVVNQEKEKKMELITELIIKTIGYKYLTWFLRNPILVYLPGQRSLIRTTIEGEHVDIIITCKFKGDAERELNARMNETSDFLDPKSFPLFGSDHSDKLFADHDSPGREKKTMKLLKAEFASAQKQLEIMEDEHARNEEPSMDDPSPPSGEEDEHARNEEPSMDDPSPPSGEEEA